MRLSRLALAGIVGVLCPSLLSAHHAFSAEYDINRQRELRGTVSRVEWTNPHVRFYVDVRGEDGTISTWDLELQSANTLTRAGWSRDSLKAGDEVVLSVYLAKDGSQRGNARGNVALADGRLLFAGDPPGAGEGLAGC
jgi:hypothetical protein